MSNVRLNVMDHERTLHTLTDVSWSDAIICSLGMEPEMISEVVPAMSRFFRPPVAQLMADWRKGVCEEPGEQGLVILDLASRTIVHRLVDHEILTRGEYPWHEDDSPTDVWLPFALPSDWLLHELDDDWRELVDVRRAERARYRELDARLVLYDRLCDELAAECRAAEDDSPETVRRIHANWLMTPRTDLAGHCPREWIVGRREQIDLELELQTRIWTLRREPPLTLSRHAYAYQYGGLGTHEAVLYYDLIRHLICEGLAELQRGTDSSELAAILRDRQREWLRSPHPEMGPPSPAEIIDRERMRLPLCDSPSSETGGSTACHDRGADDSHLEECPICRMMANQGGLTFIHLDGSQLDSDFAFSLHATEAEWEEEQQMWGEWAESPISPDDDGEDDLGNSLWRSSFFNASFLETVPPAVAVQVLLFDVGAKLHELREDLGHEGAVEEVEGDAGPTLDKADGSGQANHRPLEGCKHLGDQLSTHLDNLQAAIATGSTWQVNAVAGHFAATLGKIQAALPHLGAKCEDFTGQLDRIVQSLSDCGSAPQALVSDRAESGDSP